MYRHPDQLAARQWELPSSGWERMGYHGILWAVNDRQSKSAKIRKKNRSRVSPSLFVNESWGNGRRRPKTNGQNVP
jgi:hypothetical protein